MAYHLTGRDEYAEAARRDMVAAAGFRNWNPSHFLDVGEMTAALGLGYDWLYHWLDQEDRDAIRKAIVEKGLEAVRPGMWWLEADNNWNQVCNGGLAIGALAVREHEPEAARRTLERTLRLLPRSMEAYQPDGAYPEGPGYWKYGTAYNVLFIEALRSALGTDAGLLERFPGFLKSGVYARHALGPSGVLFNYSDCGRDVQDSPNAPLFWFARELERPGLLDYQHDVLPAFLEREQRPTTRKRRFLPFALLWAPMQEPGHGKRPLSWQGAGPTPVAFHRTSWDDPEAVYVGIKGGRPAENHGHMDIGTFVIDADGVRWAEDLGKESYGAMEKHGVRIWDRSQKGGRWKVFRHNNRSHNTLVVDGKLQRVAAVSPIVRGSLQGPERFTIVDMGPAYKGLLAAARRGIKLEQSGRVTVQDEIAADDACTVRWAMATRARVEVLEPHRARLTRGEREMYLVLDGPDSAAWQQYPAEPNYDFARSNEGITMIGFTVEVPAGERLAWRVIACREESAALPERAPLEDW
jgi:hypothetical protein